jgi:hypothetical protein
MLCGEDGLLRERLEAKGSAFRITNPWCVSLNAALRCPLVVPNPDTSALTAGAGENAAADASIRAKNPRVIITRFRFKPASPKFCTMRKTTQQLQTFINKITFDAKQKEKTRIPRAPASPPDSAAHYRLAFGAAQLSGLFGFGLPGPI